jgi:hypothetical protein
MKAPGAPEPDRQPRHIPPFILVFYIIETENKWGENDAVGRINEQAL